MARPFMVDVLALFAALLAASNIHQDKPSSLSSMAGSPVARQHPFGLGICPIQQSGKEVTSLPPPPLRTVRAAFTAHGSSKPEPYLVGWHTMDLSLQLLA